MRTTALLLALTPLLASAQAPLPREKVVEQIAGGFSVLNRMYWSEGLGIWLDRPGDDLRGHYEGRRNPPWWTSANAVEIMIDFMDATGRKDFDRALTEMYDLHRAPGRKNARMIAALKQRGQWSDADEEKNQRREKERAEREKSKPADSPKGKQYYVDFCNEYIDDSGWWGISWLKMYDRTGDAAYLKTARVIQEHMASTWRPDKGGGIMWCEEPDKLKANAITNSLFIVLSARLANRTGEKAYLDWAKKTLDWERETKLYDGTGIVDAPGHKGDYWSYNQGVYVGGLQAMYEATGDRAYLEEAATVADSVIARSGMVSPAGVVVEKLGTNGWDGGMFKGIMCRYFGQLRDALRRAKVREETASRIDTVLQTTGTSILQHSLRPDGQFTAEWHENAKNREVTFNTQSSALAALVSLLPAN